MSSTRRWIRRVCFAGALALTGAAMVPQQSSAQVDESDRPESFLGHAYATAVQLVGNTDPPQTLPELLRLDIPHGESSFGAGSLSRARASVAYPGAIGGAGSLLCLAGFPCDRFPGFPPAWPFDATAEYPGEVDADAAVGGPVVNADQLKAAHARADAHAGRDYVDTVATSQSFSFLNMSGGSTVDPASAVVATETAVARTHQEFDGGVLVSSAESVLSGVSLFAGAVEIDQIRATSVSRADGADVLEAEPSLVVSGVTVGGQPARITSSGLEIGGERRDQGAINSVVGGFEQLVSNGTIDIRLVDSEGTFTDGQGVGEVLGVLVSWRLDASGFPAGTAVVGNALLGSVRTMAKADLAGADSLIIDDFGFGFDVGPTAPEENLFGSTFGPANDLPVPGPSTDAGVSDFQSPGNQNQAPSRAARTEQAARFEILGEDVSDRVTLLYGAAALAVLGLALGTRLPGTKLGA